MSPKRFIALLFMVTVLLGMFGIVAAVIGGGIGLTQVAREFRDDFADGEQVQSGRTDLHEPYKELSISGPINLVWKKDKAAYYEASGDKELMSRLETKFENGVLQFGFKHGNFSSGEVTVTIHGPQPTVLNESGSGSATLSDLAGGKFALSVAGSGSAELNGKLDDLTVTVTGSGEVDADDVEATSANATVTGSGTVDLNVVKNLVAAITGSGTIRYHGSPSVQKAITGSGSVESED